MTTCSTLKSEQIKWRILALSLYLFGQSSLPADINSSPSITTQPTNQSADVGGSVNLSVTAGGATGIQWQRNGTSVDGATSSSFAISNLQPANTGLYTAVVSGTSGSTTSSPAIVGLTSSIKLVGQGTEFANIAAPNGNVYDQILLGGAAATVCPDDGQILRISFIDLNDDIVQVEMSGAGALSLVLAGASGPVAPVNYNQSVTYMKGHAGIVVTGANETTNLSIFSVGRANATNQALFKDNIIYDGFADIAFIAITSVDGRFGGLRAANAHMFASQGFTGVFAPNVQFTGPVFVGNITTTVDSTATPLFIIGSSPDIRVTGGDLYQGNGRAVQVKGITQLNFTAGSNSQGLVFAAQQNKGVLEQDGTNITAQVTTNSGPSIDWTKYSLVFADDFDGNALDLTKWQYRTDGKVLSQQQAANVSVSGGLLHIALRKESVGTFNYSGGGIISIGRFGYGYYEARIKCPPGAGWHSSFWSQAYNGSDTATQVARQEVDFIEQDSAQPHSFTANYHRWNPGPAITLGSYPFSQQSANMSDFHVIGALYLPTRVLFYFDEVQWRPTVDLSSESTFQGDANIWLTSIATQLPDAAQLPGEMQVDWIRFYAAPPGAIPPAPTALAAVSGVSNQISLNWTSSVQGSSYNIKRALTTNGPYSFIGSATTNAYVDTSAINGTTYHYAVSAINSSGIESNDSQDASATAGTVLIIDNAGSPGTEVIGNWNSSTFNAGYYGVNYFEDGNTGKIGGKSVTYYPNITVTGLYDVYINWPEAANRATNTPVDVSDGSSTQTFRINQQSKGSWVLLGSFMLNAGAPSFVRVRNDGANGYVIADAVKFVLR